MPVERTEIKHVERVSTVGRGVTMNSRFFNATNAPPQDDNEDEKMVPQSMGAQNLQKFPTTPMDREKYTTSTGKKLTEYQWAVYDFLMTVPRGKVATYKDVASAAGGSPRSVGSALKNNPFSPYVPCHRIIASNHFIGGFFGEWGKDHKSGQRYYEKVKILSGEGVDFDSRGRLLSPEKCVWKPSS